MAAAAGTEGAPTTAGAVDPLQLLTLGEAARVARVTVHTLRSWDEAGLLPHTQQSLGRGRFYCIQDLRAARPSARHTGGWGHPPPPRRPSRRSCRCRRGSRAVDPPGAVGRDRTALARRRRPLRGVGVGGSRWLWWAGEAIGPATLRSPRAPSGLRRCVAAPGCRPRAEVANWTAHSAESRDREQPGFANLLRGVAHVPQPDCPCSRNRVASQRGPCSEPLLDAVRPVSAAGPSHHRPPQLSPGGPAIPAGPRCGSSRRPRCRQAGRVGIDGPHAATVRRRCGGARVACSPRETPGAGERGASYVPPQGLLHLPRQRRQGTPTHDPWPAVRRAPE